MELYANGSDLHSLTAADLRASLAEALGRLGPRRRVLIIPPDITRFHSRAGELTCMAYDFFGDSVTDILPALGTHRPMTEAELDRMFPGIPHSLFRVHDWRNDVVRIGEVPADYIRDISEGALSYSWPVELNRLVWEGHHDLILSIGQVVPHEVIGLANYNKNLLIGCGGPESINKSHFLGAVYGMERIMGVADNPVRRLLNYASGRYLADLPIVYVQTVIADSPGPVTRGIFIGSNEDVFFAAAELSARVNIIKTDRPLNKVVVWLDPGEYRSTWLGNKSIYRTRMAIADGGELIVVAPGVREFGEDPEIDRLIRKYGYHGTPATLESVRNNPELQNNLSAAAHLIHGSSEGRFRIRYCPGHLSQREVEEAGFDYGHPEGPVEMYNPARFQNGFHTNPAGEEFYYIRNPAVGLWGKPATS
jgi:nickel-dependent lactate racemase